MRRLLAVPVSLGLLAASAGGAFAQASDSQTAEQTRIYDAYAAVRDELLSCHTAKANDALTEEEEVSCRRLARRYVLFSYPGTGTDYYIHCNRSTKCPPAPYGAPSSRGPYPRGSFIWHWNSSTSSRA